MELLPLVEMYCRWELEKDCNDLRALMVRYDSELELETHELGRSLLFMLRNDDVDLDTLPRSMLLDAPANLFHDICDILAASAMEIRDLHN